MTQTAPIAAAANGQSLSLRSHFAEGVFRAVPQLTQDLSKQPAPRETTVEFLGAMAAGETPEDALAFAAHALRPRHSVWWGHECLQARPELLVGSDRQMLALAAQWVAAQDEQTRTTAMAQAMVAERGPGAWVALAAGWSGGSMAPPDQQEIPVPPFAVGRAVMTGVLLFLARMELPQRRRWLAHFVGMAQVLATSE